MKKILPGLVLLSLLAVLVVPQIASAQAPPECCKIRRAITIDTEVAKVGDIVGAKDGYCPIGTITVPTEKWGLFCVINTINTIVDWIFVVLIALVVIFVMMGAINILLAGGDPEKVGTGRNYIMFAAIGLIVALLARAVPAIVKAVMGY